MSPVRVPPGRAGRLRLRHSLETATRGADLLDQKLRILRAEQRRLAEAEAAAAEQWRGRAAEAERWLLRGVLLGGEEGLRALAARPPAGAAVQWTTTMGVRHPAGCAVSVPPRPPEATLPANTALAKAEDAYREAVGAAAAHAAARAASRLLAAESAATRQRVRALRRHWIPRLRAALAAAELALEQAEHEDAVRRRWAASRAGRPPGA